MFIYLQLRLATADRVVIHRCVNEVELDCELQWARSAIQIQQQAFADAEPLQNERISDVAISAAREIVVCLASGMRAVCVGVCVGMCVVLICTTACCCIGHPLPRSHFKTSVFPKCLFRTHSRLLYVTSGLVFMRTSVLMCVCLCADVHFFECGR